MLQCRQSHNLKGNAFRHHSARVEICTSLTNVAFFAFGTFPKAIVICDYMIRFYCLAQRFTTGTYRNYCTLAKAVYLLRRTWREFCSKINWNKFCLINGFNLSRRNLPFSELKNAYYIFFHIIVKLYLLLYVLFFFILLIGVTRDILRLSFCTTYCNFFLLC